jgi:hypothetical protein
VRQASSNSAIGYFLFSGTNSSRSASLVACSEIASAGDSASPSGAIIGTTPEVETVMRRRDRHRPSCSVMTPSAAIRLSKL